MPTPLESLCGKIEEAIVDETDATAMYANMAKMVSEIETSLDSSRFSPDSLDILYDILVTLSAEEAGHKVRLKTLLAELRC